MINFHMAARSYLPPDMAMTYAHDFFEWQPLPSVLDATDTDQLLQKLLAVHGQPRFDIAPELNAAARRAASRPASNNALKTKQKPILILGGGLVKEIFSDEATLVTGERAVAA